MNRGTPGDAPIAGEAEGGERVTSGSDPAALRYRRRKRWPIWSEQGRDQRFTICNICGFSEPLHSTVCPFGPEPTRSRERR